ncbi:10322_t:CDS:2, partial [Acaulospora colombiana]
AGDTTAQDTADITSTGGTDTTTDSTALFLAKTTRIDSTTVALNDEDTTKAGGSKLVQGQDPANDPVSLELFFDPVTKATVLRGAQANTAPFGGANNNGGGQDTADPEPVEEPAATTTAAAEETVDATGTCPPASTVTVTVGAASTETAAATTEASATTSAEEADPSGAHSFVLIPQGTHGKKSLQGPGFDGRKLAEFSFQPENRNEFAQSSALNGCQAPQETVDACRNAIVAVANVAGGAKADQFNAALGIETNFAQVPAAVGGGVGSADSVSTANFNNCEAPQIAFGIFDGRKENSFAPATPSFVHGSALNPNIITQFICDQVKDRCNANQVAIDKCEAAKAATVGLTGQAVADAFNAAISA